MSSQRVDCIIIGGGLVGSLLAISLGKEGLRVVVLESQKKEDVLQARHDGRVSAIAYGSKEILDQAGIWEKVAEGACPIHHIRISDHQNPAFVHFTAEEVKIPALGYMVENLHLRKALIQSCSEIPTLSWEAPVALRSLNLQEGGGQVILEDGRLFEAPLIVGADGRGSFSRQQAGLKVRSWNYEQTALVAQISHTLDHENVAHEHFMPEGPVALLPLVGGYGSSLVWTLSPARAAFLYETSEEEFVEALTKAFGPYLGQLSLASSRWSYPLGGQLSSSFVGQRFALVGDSAHVMHPVAGQGLNVGIFDAACLARLVKEWSFLGLDWGSPLMLSSYERERRKDAWALIASTHGVVRLFSTASPLVRKLRQMGMNLIQHLPFAREAMIHRASRL